MSRLSLRIWTATGVMVLSFAVYESAKTVLFPRMSLIQSHVITVSVVGLCSFLISRYTLGRYNAAVKEIDEQANAINEANRLFSSVFANLREGVILVNSRKDVVLYNAAAAGMLNLSRSSEGGPSRSGPPPGFAGLHPGITKPAAGQPALRLVHATRNPTVNEAFRRALEDGATSDDRVEFFSHELKSYQVSVAPLSQGLAVGVFFDITELERLEKVRREFFSNLSHELRTPLTAILALAETLLNGAIDDQENNQRFIEKVYKHAVRMSQLVSDISDLSAIESGAVTLSLAPVRLLDAISEVVGTIETKAAPRSIEVAASIPPDILVCADATRLGQILNNLVDNAVKFNRKDGRVKIDAAQTNGYVTVTIADTGIGIAQADLPRIFERLYRADKSRSHGIEGTGLGLAIVKHLVHAHGGEVSATSEVGRGSKFTFTLPAARAEQIEGVPARG